MERLTFYDDFGNPCYKTKQYSELHGGYVETVISNSDVAQKLAAYEDAEEQRRLVELPCKVGVDVYALINKEVKICCCVGWNWNGGNIYMLCMDRETGIEYSFFDFHFTGVLSGFKSVFLTHEEAEAALKVENKGNEHGVD